MKKNGAPARAKTKEWKAGHRAAQLMQPRVNPHSPGTIQYQDWESGYEAGDER